MDMQVATIEPPVTGGLPPENRRRLSWKLAVAVLIVAWLPIPFGAHITALVGCYALLAAAVAVLVTRLRT